MARLSALGLQLIDPRAGSRVAFGAEAKREFFWVILVGQARGFSYSMTVALRRLSCRSTLTVTPPART